jgi:hypothetical protein
VTPDRYQQALVFFAQMRATLDNLERMLQAAPAQVVSNEERLEFARQRKTFFVKRERKAKTVRNWL